MYENIGAKLKGLASIVGVVALGGGVLGCMVLTANGSLLAWPTLIFGVIGLISSWPLYGFGQLVEDVHAIRMNGEAHPTDNSQVNSDELPEL